MPTAAALLQWMGVGGCGCPISSKVSLNTLPCFMFKNNAPNSASAADEATNLRAAHNVWMALLRHIG